MDKVKIVFQVPGKDAPGFLRRLKRSTELFQAVNVPDPAPDAWDKYVEFLADFVIEPADRAEALEALWEASEEQLDALLAQIRGRRAEPPLASSPPSSTG